MSCSMKRAERRESKRTAYKLARLIFESRACGPGVEISTHGRMICLHVLWYLQNPAAYIKNRHFLNMGTKEFFQEVQ